MNHDNENAPRTPAEHRAYVASLAAKQNTQREVRARTRGWPTGARLQRARSWPELDALRRYAAEEGVDLAGGFDAANDNTPKGEFQRPEICLVDARLNEEHPDGDDVMAAWEADEKDRKEGRPEKAIRIKYGARGKVVAVMVRGRYRSMVESFNEPRGPAAGAASIGTGYSMPDELPDANDDMASHLDHEAMKKRLGVETCRLLELALGDATSQEIGELHGGAGKTAERLGVKLVDIAIAKLMAEYAARDTADREAA